jgi:hypothetical protein
MWSQQQALIVSVTLSDEPTADSLWAAKNLSAQMYRTWARLVAAGPHSAHYCHCYSFCTLHWLSQALQFPPVSSTITRSEGLSLTVPGSAFHTAGALIRLRPYRPETGQASGWGPLHSDGRLAGLAASIAPTASPKTESTYLVMLSWISGSDRGP